MFEIGDVTARNMIKGLRLEPGFEKIQRAQVKSEVIGDNNEIVIIKAMINVNYNKMIYIVTSRKVDTIESRIQVLYKQEKQEINLTPEELATVISLAHDYNDRLLSYPQEKDRVVYLQEANLIYKHDYRSIMNTIRYNKETLNLQDEEDYKIYQDSLKRRKEIEKELEELETKVKSTFANSYKLANETRW